MTRFMSRLLLSATLIGLAVINSGSAQAAFTVYTNLAAFQGAAGSTSLEDFTSSATFNTTGAFGPNAYNGFTATGNGNGNNIGIHTAGVGSSGQNFPIPAAFLGQNFFSWGNLSGGVISPLTLAFGPGTTAFGFDWFNTDRSDQYRITFNPGSVTFAAPPFTVANGQTSSGFFGVVSDTPFTTAVIANQFEGGYISDEGFDNVRVSAPVTATPAPPTLLAAIVGAIGFGFGRRRRAAKTVSV